MKQEDRPVREGIPVLQGREEVKAEYVAPARFVLTVLHRKKPDGGANIDAASGERVDGWTTCGRPMVASELWRPVDGRDGDQLCTKCMPASLRCAQAVAEAEGMEATLC